jgi:heme exporter protein A
MISVSGLTKRYGYRLVLRDLDLHVGRGEIVALLGPNGAGKSTLLRILATLSRPTFGQVELAGFSLPTHAASARAYIGYLGHQPLLYEDLTGEQNLYFFASLYRVPRARNRVDELLDLVGLETRRKEQVRTFSRGMQQRLGVARAVLAKPKILLLDEPHSGLDKSGAAMIDKLLRDTTQKGSAVLIATHDQNRALALTKRIEILAAGSLVTVGRRPSKAQLSAQYDRAQRANA